MNNLELWNKVKQPPASVLKQIKGGRLSGMTDISPQYRYQVLTEIFGVCGIGWKYTIDELWQVPGSDNQVIAWARISLYIKDKDSWSDPIQGIGGSMHIEKEKAGLHTSDEGYKMAVTDALSVACKMLGIGADIYLGRWDGSKYKDSKPESTNDQPAPEKPKTASASNPISDKQKGMLHFKMTSVGLDKEAEKAFFDWVHPANSKEASEFIDRFDNMYSAWIKSKLKEGEILCPDKNEVVDSGKCATCFLLDGCPAHAK
jgi:hypothetical protein